LSTSTRDPEHYQIETHRPADFESFWSANLEAAARLPLDPELRYDELRSTPDVEVYDIHYTSLDGVRISGWYAHPRESLVAPPYPGLAIVPGYISDPVIPKSWAKKGYAVLAVAPRGKVRSRSQVDAKYPGLLVTDSVDRNTYGYRPFYVDACRGVDFLLSRPEVDHARIGVHGSSQGGALTVIVSALRRDVVVCGAAGAPYLAAHLVAAELTNSYPYHEITEHLHVHPEEEAAIRETLPYFDIINFAPMITAPMFVYLGLEDDVCPPETGFALVRAMTCPTEVISTPRAAHDSGRHFIGPKIDAFLAGHLKPVAVAGSEFRKVPSTEALA